MKHLTTGVQVVTFLLLVALGTSAIVFARASDTSNFAGSMSSPSNAIAIGPTASASLGGPKPSSSVACLNFVSNLDRPSDVRSLAQTSAAAVIGTVLDVSSAKWATADGNAPAGRYAPTALEVYRVAHLKVKAVGRGQVAPGSVLTVRFPGGSIGCDNFMLSGSAEPTPGRDLAVFLGAIPSLHAAASADSDVVEALQVNGGQIVGPDGEAMTTDAFLSSVGQG